MLVDAELPFSLISAAFPIIFFLLRRSMNHGVGSLFSSRTPTKLRSYQLQSSQGTNHRRLPSTQNSQSELRTKDVEVFESEMTPGSAG